MRALALLLSCAGLLTLTLALPAGQPTEQPSGQPSGQPTAAPSYRPSGQPSSGPTSEPSGQPSCEPTGQPSGEPTEQPSEQPTEPHQAERPMRRQPAACWCWPSHSSWQTHIFLLPLAGLILIALALALRELLSRHRRERQRVRDRELGGYLSSPSLWGKAAAGPAAKGAGAGAVGYRYSPAPVLMRGPVTQRQHLYWTERESAKAKAAAASSLALSASLGAVKDEAAAGRLAGALGRERPLRQVLSRASIAPAAVSTLLLPPLLYSARAGVGAPPNLQLSQQRSPPTCTRLAPPGHKLGAEAETGTGTETGAEAEVETWGAEAGAVARPIPPDRGSSPIAVYTRQAPRVNEGIVRGRCRTSSSSSCRCSSASSSVHCAPTPP
jgi:hypothetical protein